MTSYRRRSACNEQMYEKLERLAISSKPRLHSSQEEINHQRVKGSPRDVTSDHLRSRSNTVPSKLPSDKVKELRSKINHRMNRFNQTNRHFEHDKAAEPLKGPKKYLKPLVTQSKIPADALEDPLGSSERSATRNKG